MAQERFLDEIVAGNVRRIREEKRLSVIDLAEMLNVSRHQVYDFERPRTGMPQRQFLLIDLYRLCVGLDVTLFDLLLPPAGESEDLRMDDRESIGLEMFGLYPGHLTPESIAALVEKRDAYEKQMVRVVKKALDEMEKGDQ